MIAFVIRSKQSLILILNISIKFTLVVQVTTTTLKKIEMLKCRLVQKWRPAHASITRVLTELFPKGSPSN